MPIVIHELVIKGEVAPAAERDRTRESRPPTRSASEMNALVEACVEEVMRILDRKQER